MTYNRMLRKGPLAAQVNVLASDFPSNFSHASMHDTDTDWAGLI